MEWDMVLLMISVVCGCLGIIVGMIWRSYQIERRRRIEVCSRIRARSSQSYRIGNDDRMQAGHIGYPPGAVRDGAGNVQLLGCISSPPGAMKLEPQVSFPKESKVDDGK